MDLVGIVGPLTILRTWANIRVGPLGRVLCLGAHTVVGFESNQTVTGLRHQQPCCKRDWLLDVRMAPMNDSSITTKIVTFEFLIVKHCSFAICSSHRFLIIRRILRLGYCITVK